MTSMEEYEGSIDYLESIAVMVKSSILEHFYKYGPGAEAIDWKEPGAENRCIARVNRFIDREDAKLLCQKWERELENEQC